MHVLVPCSTTCVLRLSIGQVHEKVKRQAVNVMDLYAKRARIERPPCRPDGPEMEEFCKGFQYEPTKDQVGRGAGSEGGERSRSARSLMHLTHLTLSLVTDGSAHLW